MATNKKPEETVEAEAPKDERVEVFIPRGADSDDPNVFVGINGVNYILPKGKKSMVPPEVAAEIMRSRKAVERQDERIDEMLSASK